MNLMTDAAARALDPTADLTTNAADILFYATGNCAFGKVLIARSRLCHSSRRRCQRTAS
jgi:hypothetical protein